MTRKDFELVAGTLAQHRTYLANAQAHNGVERRLMVAAQDSLALDLALALRATNPRFDVERFLKAAGVR